MRWPWSKIVEEKGYKIYSTDFDQIVTGDDLHKGLSQDARDLWKEQISAFVSATELIRTQATINCISSVDTVLARPSMEASSTAVSILIDHSGSMRGQRAVIALLLVELVADFCSRLGVKYEILGFTTVEWRGGKSRDRWLSRGRPAKLGRLNDTLHIVYREGASANHGAPCASRHLLRSDLLKENIDGEALLWAFDRIKGMKRRRNLIIVLSDGAPVDDSTLAENDPGFLWAHLLSTISEISATPGFDLAGIGIDLDLSNHYRKNLTIRRLDQIPAILPDFLANLLE